MTASLALLLAAGAAYLAAHVIFERLARRFLVVSGAEYLVLGILLGPQVSGVLSRQLLDSLAPILTLALGWIGVIIGTRFELRSLINAPARLFRIGLAESTLTFALVAGLEFVALRLVIGATDVQALFASIVLGAMAVACSDVGLTLVAQRLRGGGRIVEQLQLSSNLNALFAILTFGILVCAYHAPAPLVRPLTATEWAVVSIAIGVLGGTLFHVFLGDTPDADRLFVALVGGVVMVSGAATYLRLSPLMSAMFFGIVLINTTRRPEALVETITRVERPMYFVLLIFGGATWQASHRAWLLPVLLYLVARLAGKIGGSRLAARANGALDELGPHWGRALLGQGRVVVAIGLSYLHQDRGPFPNLIFTAAVASVLLTEFLSARTAHSVISARVMSDSDVDGAQSDESVKRPPSPPSEPRPTAGHASY